MDTLGPDFSTLLTRGASYALLAAAAWAAAVLGAVGTEAWTSGRVRLAHRTGCPAAARACLLGLFLALSAGITPAQASDWYGAGDPSGPVPTTALDGLPLPDRALDAAPPHARRPDVVVVRPGASLWRIARALLPRDATDPTVAAGVRSLYARNRPTVGGDPDLVRPGQRLAVPRALADFPDPPTHPEEP